MCYKMFKWIKNQFLAKMQVEKFISSQYVKFLIVIEKLLRSDMSKEDILVHILKIKDSVIKTYNLSDKDIVNEK